MMDALRNALRNDEVLFDEDVCPYGPLFTIQLGRGRCLRASRDEEDRGYLVIEYPVDDPYDGELVVEGANLDATLALIKERLVPRPY